MTDAALHPNALIRLLAPGLALLLGAGCATGPFEIDDSAIAPIGPAHVLAESGHEGQRAVWGGRILNVTNLADHTEIEVVSLPLDGSDRPRLSAESGVRFLVVQSGFLEPTRFAPGRYLTVLGEIAGLDERLVGDYVYEQPLLRAEQIHLWPADTTRWRPRGGFSIGIGVRL